MSFWSKVHNYTLKYTLYTIEGGEGAETIPGAKSTPTIDLPALFNCFTLSGNHSSPLLHCYTLWQSQHCYTATGSLLTGSSPSSKPITLPFPSFTASPSHNDFAAFSLIFFSGGSSLSSQSSVSKPNHIAKKWIFVSRERPISDSQPKTQSPVKCSEQRKSSAKFTKTRKRVHRSHTSCAKWRKNETRCLLNEEGSEPCRSGARGWPRTTQASPSPTCPPRGGWGWGSWFWFWVIVI